MSLNKQKALLTPGALWRRNMPHVPWMCPRQEADSCLSSHDTDLAASPPRSVCKVKSEQLWQHLASNYYYFLSDSHCQWDAVKGTKTTSSFLLLLPAQKPHSIPGSLPGASWCAVIQKDTHTCKTCISFYQMPFSCCSKAFSVTAHQKLIWYLPCNPSGKPASFLGGGWEAAWHKHSSLWQEEEAFADDAQWMGSSSGPPSCLLPFKSPFLGGVFHEEFLWAAHLPF